MSFLRIFPISLFFFFLDIKKGLTLHKVPSYLVLNNLFPFITTKSLYLFIFLILSGWIQLGIEKLFVLTTRTVHWFQERGFQLAEIADLPDKKRQHYNYQRRSKILIQALQNKKG